MQLRAFTTPKFRALILSNMVHTGPSSSPTTPVPAATQPSTPPPSAQAVDPNNDPEEQLALPWHGTPETADTPTQVNVGSNDSVRLECLGPMVINLDGTISRITNWSEMSEIERTATLRIVTKRNRERRLALNKAQRIQIDPEHAPDR